MITVPGCLRVFVVSWCGTTLAVKLDYILKSDSKS